MTLPGFAWLPEIHDGQTDHHGHGNVDQANQDELRPLTQRQTGAKQRVDNRKEDERHSERLQQPDHPQSEFSQLFVAKPVQIGFLTENDAEHGSAHHGKQDLCIERKSTRMLHSGTSSRGSLHRCPLRNHVSSPATLR